MQDPHAPELPKIPEFCLIVGVPYSLAAILWSLLAILLAGCSTYPASDNYHRRDGIWGEHDAYLGAMQESRTTSSTSDVYLAPGTTMEIIRTRPRLTRPVYTLYDPHNNIYIGVGPDGKGYILDRPWDGVPILERDITRYSAPHDRHGHIHTDKHTQEDGYRIIIGTSRRDKNKRGITTWPRRNHHDQDRQDRHDHHKRWHNRDPDDDDNDGSHHTHDGQDR